MGGFSPEITGAIVASLVLLSVHLWLWRMENVPALRIATYAWGLYVLRLFGIQAESRWGGSFATLAWIHGFALGNALLLAYSYDAFLQRKTEWLWSSMCVLSYAWILAFDGLGVGRFWGTLPAYVFVAVVYIRNGVLFWRRRISGEASERALGMVFILWGVHKLDAPWRSTLGEFSALGYGLTSLFTLSAAMGILTLYFLVNRKRLLDSKQDLARNEEQYRFVVEMQTELVVALDGQGGILFANPAFCRLFSGDTVRLEGMSMQALAQARGMTETLDALRAVAHLPHRAYYEEQECTGDVCRWIAWTMSATLGVDGKMSRLLMVGRDVTDLRKTEQQLRQSEKMQAIGQLAGGIAHDFNNQLAGIMGYAEILQNRLEDENLRRYAAQIVTAADRSSSLIGKLLAFSRKGNYLAAPVNLHTTVEEVIGILEHSIDKRIRVRKYLEAELPVTMGDPGQVQNAILNLAINARDAMAGGGTLTFTVRNCVLDELATRTYAYEVAPGRYVEVDVSDTGCGIPKDLQSRIFEPFFTTKEEGKGTGMGLAAVYGTVKSHRGIINLYSEVGKGATFKVYLPVASAAPSAQTRSKTDVIPLAAAGGLVLVIDDEDIFRNMIGAMLKQLGFTPIVCASAADGLREMAARRDDIVLVVLDMIMPDLSGAEVFSRIRALCPTMRVLLASGYSLNGEAQRLLDEGACGYIQKPFRISDLSTVLKSTFLH